MRHIDPEQNAVTEEQAIDDALDGSFPASDPPPWTLGASPDARRLPEYSDRLQLQTSIYSKTLQTLY